MNRYLLGGFAVLLMLAAGLFWWQGRAVIQPAPAVPPPPAAPVDELAAEPVLPASDAAGQRGPAPPEATDASREQRRFWRYDRNRDGGVSRNEMLSTRTNAFKKLDGNGDNLLTFEEWAVATSNRFRGADSNGDNTLTQQEFRSTAPRRQITPNCNC